MRQMPKNRLCGLTYIPKLELQTLLVTAPQFNRPPFSPQSWELLPRFVKVKWGNT